MVEQEFHEYRRIADTKIDELRQDFTEHTIEERTRDALMMEKFEVLSNRVETLIDLWSQAKGALTFIKVVVGLAASVAAIVAYFRGS